jgi:hypothetical protein
METLAWTRGRTLLLDCVDKRLKCPSCGDWMVRMLFEPRHPPAGRDSRLLGSCEALALPQCLDYIVFAGRFELDVTRNPGRAP